MNTPSHPSSTGATGLTGGRDNDYGDAGGLMPPGDDFGLPDASFDLPDSQVGAGSALAADDPRVHDAVGYGSAPLDDDDDMEPFSAGAQMAAEDEALDDAVEPVSSFEADPSDYEGAAEGETFDRDPSADFEGDEEAVGPTPTGFWAKQGLMVKLGMATLLACGVGAGALMVLEPGANRSAPVAATDDAAHSPAPLPATPEHLGRLGQAERLGAGAPPVPVVPPAAQALPDLGTARPVAMPLPIAGMAAQGGPRPAMVADDLPTLDLPPAAKSSARAPTLDLPPAASTLTALAPVAGDVGLAAVTPAADPTEATPAVLDLDRHLQSLASNVDLQEDRLDQVEGRLERMGQRLDTLDAQLTTAQATPDATTKAAPAAAAAATPTPEAPEVRPYGQEVSARSTLNRRSGPGTGTNVVGQLMAGDWVRATARTVDGKWLQLQDDSWVAAWLVQDRAAYAKARERVVAAKGTKPATSDGVDRPTYRLMSAVPERAWLQGPDGVVEVSTNGSIAGWGRVVSIRQRPDGWWTVATEGGVVAAAKPAGG